MEILRGCFKEKKFIFCSFMVWMLALGEVQASELTESLRKLVHRSRIKKESLGVVVKNLTTKQVVYEINGQRAYTPASLTKLVTAYGVLKLLPRGQRFSTRLVSGVKVQGGNLQGNLYLVGGGDPTFVSESMWRLVNQLQKVGLKRVKGSIVVDDSFFDDRRYGNTDGRIDRAYDAPVGAMSFNWNSVNVYVRPSPKVSQPPLVFADPRNEFIEVVNRAKTVSRQKKPIHVERVEVAGNPYKNRILVTGQIGVQERELTFYKSITRPSLWSGYNLKAFLESAGIQVDGLVKRGVAPRETHELAHLESESLFVAVSKMMKFSNNYISEMLIKHLSFLDSAATGNMSGGLRVLSKQLLRLGFKDFSLKCGSGLCRENKIRPVDISQLLERAFSDFTLSSEFLSSLPIGGVDGTLKDRFASESSWIRAKTGQLCGVIGLAGYVESKKGHVKSFVFIYNGSGLGKHMTRAKALFDRMVVELVE